MTTSTHPTDLPEEDRRQCLFDELVYGVSYIEETPDGVRRRDPVEVVEHHE